MPRAHAWLQPGVHAGCRPPPEAIALFGAGQAGLRLPIPPHISVYLQVKLVVAQGFWIACLRCLVRVNGVMARLIDTRFICQADGASP